MMYNIPKPKSVFGYTLKTTATMEVPNGLAWTADLFKGSIKVGTVEQQGNGGADVVTILENATRKQWLSDVDRSFDGDVEGAIYWLVFQEDAKSMFGEDFNLN